MDGQVVDGFRRIAGCDAIRRRADDEVIGGSLRVDGVTPLRPSCDGPQRVGALATRRTPPGGRGLHGVRAPASTAATLMVTYRGGRSTLAALRNAS